MSHGTTKEQLVAALRAERGRWEALLEEAGEARLTQPGVTGDWAVKDVLGHLTAYVRYWGAQIRGATTGVTPTPRDLFDTATAPAPYRTVDEQNAAIHALYAPLPLPVVLAKWRAAWELVMDGVVALDEADLTTPGRFAWAGDRPLVEAMTGPTLRHPATHAADVRAWLDRADA